MAASQTRTLTRPTCCMKSVNQTVPSGPAVTPRGEHAPPYFTVLGIFHSVKTPVVMLKRAMLLAYVSANQMLPSGPVAIPCGPLGAEGVVYSAIIWPERL